MGKNLGVERGGRYANHMAGAEIAHEREVRERFAAMTRQDGRPVNDKVVYNIAEGVTVPTRNIGKLTRRLKAKKVARDVAWDAVLAPMMRDFNAVYGNDEVA